MAAWLSSHDAADPDRLAGLVAPLLALPEPRAPFPTSAPDPSDPTAAEDPADAADAADAENAPGGSGGGAAAIPVLLPVPGWSYPDLRVRAARAGVTPFALLAALAGPALAPAVGARPFPLFCPVDGRDVAGADTVGCLVATLPIAADGRETPLPDRLAAATAAVAALLTARQGSWPELLELLPAGAVPPDPPRHAAFSVNVHDPLRLPGGARGRWRPSGVPRGKFGVHLVVEIVDDEIELVVEWRDDALPPGAADRIAARYAAALHTVLDETDAPGRADRPAASG
jgi:hypothetical protein